jgi:exodeoxyribonuclease V alpha subunit
MNNAIHEDHVRITSIPYSSSSLVIFTGVPLEKNSYKTTSGKYYVTIKANPESIPVQLAIGQYWTVKGARRIEEVATGDYVMLQHIYEAPDYVECTLPESGEQLIQFIAKEKAFRGIGEVKARALWALLGNSFHSTLQTDTLEARNRLKGVLSEDSIDALYEGYEKYKNLKHTNWMTLRGIPASIQQRLLKFHDDKSVDAIQDNPYLLCGFGMSFDDVEGLIKKWTFEIAADDQRRLSAALEFALRKQVEKGHTYTKREDLVPALNKLLRNNELVASACKAGHDKAQFLLNNDTLTYHPTAQLLMESTVAKRLLTMADIDGLYDRKTSQAYRAALKELPYDLTAKQKEAVGTCLDNAVACITGGAGTGKTTVLRTALRAFSLMGYAIHAVALSGRAAMRLHESIGFTTMTIAGFLRNPPLDSTGSDKNLLVIDEASMVDLPTMYRIVTHIHPSVRIVLTGDPDQLPPIGCGKVLADIVHSKRIANTMLDIVKRQDGSTGIPEYSKLINQGEIPPKLSTASIFFHEANRSEITDRCCLLYRESPENSRIIAPTRNMVSEINNKVQSAVNSHGEMLRFTMYSEEFFLNLRLNDAVLFTKNLYHRGIQNGSLGVLSGVEPEQDDSDELAETYFGDVTLDTGDRIKITQDVLDCMELGYAITLHKAQGSQFPRVIIALHKGRIVDRAWLYTAITRAENEIHIVGSQEDFIAIAAATSNASRRNSYLLNLLI